jgi:hypothetical protein
MEMLRWHFRQRQPKEDTGVEGVDATSLAREWPRASYFFLALYPEGLLIRPKLLFNLLKEL